MSFSAFPDRIMKDNPVRTAVKFTTKKLGFENNTSLLHKGFLYQELGMGHKGLDPLYFNASVSHGKILFGKAE